MKLLLALMFLSSVAYAGPLDLLDARGNVTARVGQEYFQADGSLYNNIILVVDQGIRFQGAPWIEPYVGYNKAQATYIVGSGNTESLWGGIRNTTFLPNVTVGLEYRSTIVPDNPSIKSMVGYVQLHKGWDLLK